MLALGCAAMAAVVGCDRTTNTEKQTNEDTMTNETNETALSQHCARLFYAAKEADVPTVVEDGTFMPTLYVATEKGGMIVNLAGPESIEALRDMAAQTIREKDPDATAYLLDYASFYEKDGARKGALIMEIADKADAAAKVFVIICNRDEKTVCDPIRHEDVKSLFEYDQMKRNGNGIISPVQRKDWIRWTSK